MGVTAVATFILLLIAYIAQSPRLIKRLGLSGARLDLRARTFTGFALAMLLLAFGFFLAGVPLDGRIVSEQPLAAVTSEPTATSDTMGAVNPITPTGISQEIPQGTNNSTPTIQISGSGAMAGLPTAANDLSETNTTTDAEAGIEATEEFAPNVEAGAGTPLPTATATGSPTPTPTPAPTSTPPPTPTTTASPTPTLTPTAIMEETAVVNVGSSTVWLRRTPGSTQNLLTLTGGDIVILRPGHANVGGIIWREIITVDNASGWIEEQYLDYGEATS